MSDGSNSGYIGGLIYFGAIAPILYFVESFKLPSIYTPGLMPQPATKPEWEILGPNFKKREQATEWAISRANQYGPQASWVVYRDLFWNEEYGMPVAKDKLR
jgi:hypothetical protein